MSDVGTRDRLLDSAEALFAQSGLDATSLRDITTDAQANLAAVNYHFGSKDDLIVEVFSRRLAPTTVSRLERLHQLERSGKITLEAILDAFFRPMVQAAQPPDGRRTPFCALMGRMFTERPDIMEKVFRSQLAPVVERYVPALARLLPHLDRTELMWRLHFTIGTLAHTLAAEHLLAMISGGACDPRNIDAVVARLVAFCAAGLRAKTPAKKDSHA